MYRWREGARWKGPAYETGERLEEIRNRNGGALTPEATVEDAKNKKSPLHKQFNWNVDEAAHAHWLDTARDLISDVMVVFADEIERAPKVPMRAYSSAPLGQEGKRAYIPTIDAVRSPEVLAVVLANAKQELEGWRRRYRHYEQLADAVARVEEALAAVS